MGKSIKGKELGKGITQKKDGRYEARAVIDGHKINLVNRNLTQLKKDFETAKNKVRASLVTQTKKTLDEWYTEWFEKCKRPQLKTEMSANSYKRKAENTFVRILGEKDIDLISQLDMQEAANMLADDYSLRYLREAVGVMRECFDVAIANRLAVSNPCINITLRDNNEHQKERRVLQKWEQDLLLDVAEGRYYEIPYKILLCTGMRIGEFSGLRWEDVDFERNCIHIRRSMSTGYVKGKKIMELLSPKTQTGYRDIPFFGETKDLFAKWKVIQDKHKKELGDRWRADKSLGDLVFTTTLGSPITRYNIVHDMATVEKDMIALERMNAEKEHRAFRPIDHIHPHCLRHTFCSQCLVKGMNPVFVQRIMGHANYATTLSYTHVLDDMKNEEVAKVGNFLD